MRALTALFLLVLAAPAVHAGEAIFDPDPWHSWNRLDAALTVEDRALDPQVSDFNELQRRQFTGPEYERALSELNDFVKHKRDKLIRDPTKRALLQSKVWAVFDSVSDPTGDFRKQRDEIAWRALELTRRLALSETEIAALPDNYAATIAARSYPTTHDPANPAQEFLPADLLPVGRAWLAISDSFEFPPAAARHAQTVQGRSLFYVLIRLPGGIAATRAYTRTLAYHPKPLAWHDAYAQYPYARSPTQLAAGLPQFQAGTQVALVRRMLLPDRTGELRLTPIVESIQLRVYVTEPAADSDNNRQDTYEFRLSPQMLLANRSGLVPRQPIVPRMRTIFELPSIFQGGCLNCHGAAGIYSVQTYTQAFGRRRPSPWFEAVATDEYLNRHALDWKRRRYEWGLLRGLWEVRRP